MTSDTIHSPVGARDHLTNTTGITDDVYQGARVKRLLQETIGSGRGTNRRIESDCCIADGQFRTSTRCGVSKNKMKMCMKHADLVIHEHEVCQLRKSGNVE